MALSVYDEKIFNIYGDFYLEKTRSLQGWEAVKEKTKIAMLACCSFAVVIPKEEKGKLLQKKSWEDEATYAKRFETFFRDNSNMRHYAVWDDMMEASGVFDEDEEEEGSKCGECGVSTQGRKIRSLWNNTLCEKCGEESEEEDEEVDVFELEGLFH